VIQSGGGRIWTSVPVPVPGILETLSKTLSKGQQSDRIVRQSFRQRPDYALLGLALGYTQGDVLRLTEPQARLEFAHKIKVFEQSAVDLTENLPFNG
jgi:hypothetical protein